MSGTTSNTAFGADDSAIPAAIGGGGSAGPSVGAGDATGPIISVNTSGIDLAGLPAQYSTASADGTGLGFFTRQLEYVPTAVTVGPDDALYVSGLSGLPYPDGYSRVMRIADAHADYRIRRPDRQRRAASLCQRPVAGKWTQLRRQGQPLRPRIRQCGQHI